MGLKFGENSASGIVNPLTLAAIKESAGDIHVEPTKDRLRVRLRQDGVLQFYDVSRPP
jgi:type II secretory ATPase GspE/PulE/Tfp pilus assembly ATPase PilB-like protein